MANLNPSVSNYPQSAPESKSKRKKSLAPAILITIAFLYLGLVLFIPAINVFVQAFSKGLTPLIEAFKRDDLLEAIKLTALLAAIALPLNTIFGLSAAWAIARNKFPGKALLLSIIDLPFSISPVVAGLMIVLLYGRIGWFGSFLEANNIKIVFAFPGMLLATIFVSMPFIAREVIPVLDEMGTEQEEAARTLGASDWQIFWKVVVPNIRWGLLYGLVLTNARAMGEFGAVSVVSGNIASKTQSLPLFVEEAYKNYENEVAYSAAVLLALLAVVTLVLKEILERKTHNPNERE
ncbi:MULTISPECIES: sulfate ABC transporter permease subunit CysW [Pseudanabaena]|jgi:sulfate/thiosulfate transport system permease protein|uniref:sulfate ABC transporter permease subunit CysW n=1 Tax=Pseudanabaena TaxID=1152 RepID=UPI00247A0D88|nr:MULTISPECIES: sulfate ABC transporter permease subunit CysW [Pseudanabaena]MEA5487540.1 sulfate ABC transporter permease subunit CysW [Pseudanabaena sp. CCNP1317]WGS73987.1 sulfate ABC transporter permease subunit CysW [Pseudanabaena galeata CCNP1313]